MVKLSDAVIERIDEATNDPESVAYKTWHHPEVVNLLIRQHMVAQALSASQANERIRLVVSVRKQIEAEANNG